MTIQILGGGCPKCHALERNAREALSLLGLDATVEAVTDSDRITDMGVMFTPALAIDGVVKNAGKVLSVDDISAILSDAR